MEQYTMLQNAVLEFGTHRPTRTGQPAIGIFGETISYDMRDGTVPVITTRLINTDSIIAELVGFIRGVTSAADFRALGTKIWNGNANDAGSPGSPNAWLTNPHRKGEDDLGPIYGAQWRRWESIKMLDIPGHMEDPMGMPQYAAYTRDGYEEVGRSPVYEDGTQRVFLRKEIDQLQDLIDGIKKDPYGRRHIVTAWNPGVLKEIALPACHMMFQCYVTSDGCIDMLMYQRSADLFLGVPFNITSYGALTHVIASLTGYKPGTLNMVFGDLHIYENAVIATLEQIRREPYTSPECEVGVFPTEPLNFTVSNLESLDAITPDNIRIGKCASHPAMKVSMAV